MAGTTWHGSAAAGGKIVTSGREWSGARFRPATISNAARRPRVFRAGSRVLGGCDCEFHAGLAIPRDGADKVIVSLSEGDAVVPAPQDLCSLRGRARFVSRSAHQAHVVSVGAVVEHEYIACPETLPPWPRRHVERPAASVADGVHGTDRNLVRRSRTRPCLSVGGADPSALMGQGNCGGAQHGGRTADRCEHDASCWKRSALSRSRSVLLPVVTYHRIDWIHSMESAV